MVFFHFGGDLILALYPVASLAKDAKIRPTPQRLVAVSIGHVVNSKREVDEIVQSAATAGAVVTDPPKDRFWGGYSGYFHDPDGHLWEVAWNPAWVVAD